jgi:hypothetical protein
MSPMGATRISLIRPPHPRGMPYVPVAEATEMYRALARYSDTVATLRGMRTKAHRASQDDLLKALQALQEAAQHYPLGATTREVARLARAVARSADRIIAAKRLHAYEQALVDEGLAEWATEALRPISAWDCVGVVPPTHRLRIVGGRSLYRQAFYDAEGSENVRLVRNEPRGDDVHQISRYVTPDTRVELVRDGTVEPDPWVVLTGRGKR